MRNRFGSDQQLSFDFIFNQHIETVQRLQEEIAHDNFRDAALGNSSKYLTGLGGSNVPQIAGNEVRMEHSGSLGDEQPGQGQATLSGGRDHPLSESAGTTSAGAIGTGKQSSSGQSGTDRIGDSDNESGINRTALTASNYIISNDDRLGEGGAKTKYRDNIAAIKVIHTLRAEVRPATPEEQSILVKYVGWGGLPQVFDHRNTEWSDEFHELSSLLDKDEYDAARRSTQDAHYTAQTVIEGMYGVLGRMGFSGGKILEPSVGSGNFIGLMPESLRQSSQVTGIELDPLTAEIAKALYPQSSIINKGFEETVIPSGHFDLVIGNPPFGNQQVYDEYHPDLSRYSIHNYFIAKALDKTRPGGLVAVVVSRFFLDAQDASAREHIASQAHFLGAIRLPNNAFKKNALTEVTTDLVFFRKAMPGEEIDQNWTSIAPITLEGETEPDEINNWYIRHPELILGRLQRDKMHAWGTGPAVIAIEGQELSAELQKATTGFPEAIYTARLPEGNAVEEIKPEIEIPAHIRFGGYFLAEGRIARRLPDILDRQDYEFVEPKNDRAAARIRSLITVRDQLRELMRAEHNEWTASTYLDEMRIRLNRVYDDHVKRHGFISSISNRQSMGDDPDYPLLQSLEHDYDRGISKEVAQKEGVEPRDPSATKAPIFTRRVIKPRRTIDQVASAKDALVVSLNETGRVNVPRMVQLYGHPEEKLLEELQGLIYRNPVTKEWESSDKYLTGNVKEKLRIAEAAMQEDPGYALNVRALRDVQPADIEPVDIAVQLGSTWVPAETVSAFIVHLVGNVYNNVSYQPSLGKWIAKVGFGDATACRVQWGTEDIPANQLIMAILENRPIQVRQRQGTSPSGAPIYVVLEDRTTAANQKADEIRQAFMDWVWEDKDRREKLARIYNDRFNTNVAPKYDGSHLTLSGASMAIELRPHQKNAIWRGIQEGTALEDHVVGAGKTLVFVGTAMESKRMGLMSKPMFVVPNHLLIQWKDAFYSLYPDANILVAEKSDFEKDNRQLLFSKIATGDWDAVIVAHSSFKKIGMPPDVLQEILQEQVDDLVDAIRKLKEQDGDRFSIKQMEKTRDRMKAKLARLSETGTKDTAVDFADLGIDALFVDEAHEFKNLFINTSLNRISGLGNLAGSDKAFDLFVKARYIQKKHGNRGVFFATGTPISNTIAELYTMQRYLQYDELCRREIVHFDSWASTFGQVVAGWELDATGVNYRLNSRFSKFQNVPELIALYRTFADVVTKKDLDDYAKAHSQRPLTPRVKGGKPQNIVVERSKAQELYMGIQVPVLDDTAQPVMRGGLPAKDWNEGSIIWRMENLPRDPRLDNPLKVTNDARKAGLDFRLIDPHAEDDPGSKINTMVDKIYGIWESWAERRGTQLVFCDLSTPKGNKSGDQPSPVVVDVAEDNDQEEQTISMDELLAGGNTKFSVYEDVRQKLIDRGVPPHEVQFIHDYKTDLQKAKLFGQMNRGEIRILLGSTTKMGAGTNVQRRLVAEHHLDAPWRPSDLEQREGRIIRQGNLFYEEDPDGFEVEIYRYATKQTYDSRMWQTIEYKASGIEQFRRGDSLQRVIEDVASEAANAAEMKAAATGNPLIFIQVQLSSELKKMEAIYANYKRSQHSLESKKAWLQGSDKRAAEARRVLDMDLARRTSEPILETTQGRYDEKSREKANAIFIHAMDKAIKSAPGSERLNELIAIPIGKYRGFDLSVTATSSQVQFALKGERLFQPSNFLYRKEDNFSAGGFFQRMDNFLNKLEEGYQDIQESLDYAKEEMIKVETELQKPFAQYDQLQLLRKDAADVLAEIRKGQGNDGYVSTWLPKSMPAPAELIALHTSAQHASQIVVEQKASTAQELLRYADGRPLVDVSVMEEAEAVYFGEYLNQDEQYLYQSNSSAVIRHPIQSLSGIEVTLEEGDEIRIDYAYEGGKLNGVLATSPMNLTRKMMIIVPEDNPKDAIFIGQLEKKLEGFMFQKVGPRLVRHNSSVVEDLDKYPAGQQIRIEYRISNGVLRGKAYSQEQYHEQHSSLTL